MSNPHGTPIWYELMTADAAGSKAFYDDVIGWTIADSSDQPGMDYRMIATSDGGHVGGMLPLTEEMTSGGAFPTWLFYIGVDDVDATAALIVEKGGSIHVAPFDLPEVGRFAFATDPQGLPFYIMRGSSPDASTAYDRTGMGKCNWNELVTPDQAAGNAFYAAVFGWTYPDAMAMPGDLGDYMFIDAAGQQIGATMQHPGQGPAPAWRFYFRTPDIDDTARKVADAGGTVIMGPHDVPGGDRIIVATDPHGVVFGAVGPGNA